MGSEENGISEPVLKLTDEQVKIPITGQAARRKCSERELLNEAY